MVDVKQVIKVSSGWSHQEGSNMTYEEMYRFLFHISEGYRFLATKPSGEDATWKQHSIRTDRFVDYIIRHKEFADNNIHVSKAAFIGRKRQQYMIGEIENLVVDIDCHGEYSHDGIPIDNQYFMWFCTDRMNPDKVRIKNRCSDGHTYDDNSWYEDYEQSMRYTEFLNKFVPTLTNLSGRGIHDWWCLEPVKATKENMAMYKYVVEQIGDMFNSFLSHLDDYLDLHMDVGCSKLVNGTIRLPFTYNTEAGKESEVYGYKQVRYSLKEMATALGYKSESEKPIKESKAIIDVQEESIQKAPYKNVKSGERHSFRSENEKRAAYIEKLVEYRTTNACYRCMRNNSLFLYYNCQVALTDQETARERTWELNKMFRKSLSEGEVMNIFSSVESRGCYHYKDEEFLQKAGVSKAELEKVPFSKEKLGSNYTRNLERKERLAKRDAQVVLLYKQGYIKAEIAKETGLDTRTVSRIIKDSGLGISESESAEQVRIRDIQVIGLYKQGHIKAEIAKETGLDARTVSRIIKDADLSNSDTCIRVQQMKHKGLSQSESAKKLGLSIRTVKGYWNEIASVEC